MADPQTPPGKGTNGETIVYNGYRWEWVGDG